MTMKQSMSAQQKKRGYRFGGLGDLLLQKAYPHHPPRQGDDFQVIQFHLGDDTTDIFQADIPPSCASPPGTYCAAVN